MNTLVLLLLFTGTPDPRWLPYIGCWESTTAAAQWLCVVPAAAGPGVALVSVNEGRITGRQTIAATGERIEQMSDGCAGWERATWSAQGQRVYLEGESGCPGANRATSGIIAMSAGGEWLYVRAVKAPGGRAGIEVNRYREASAGAPIPPELREAAARDLWDVTRARMAAGAPLATDDVIEAAKHIDVAALEAWLAERAEQFAVDAKRLVALADGGVPDRVIDLLVAMAYPQAFARTVGGRGPVDSTRRAYARPFGSRLPQCDDPYLDGYAVSALDPWSRLCQPYGYSLGYGYGYSYGFGRFGGQWYPDGYPVIIVLETPSSNRSPRQHGRVVNGSGYAQGGSAGGASSNPRPSSGGGSSSSGSSSGSSSSGSGEQRTAKPRPPK